MVVALKTKPQRACHFALPMCLSGIHLNSSRERRNASTNATSIPEGTEGGHLHVASLMYWNAFRLKRRSVLLTARVAWDHRPLGRVRDQRRGCDVPLVLATTSIAIQRIAQLKHFSERQQEDKTNLFRNGLNPAHVL